MTTQAQRRGRAGKRDAPKAQYDAAGNGRRLKGWTPPSAGPNRAIKGHSKIRARAQDVVRNDWSGESSVQKWTTALVGIGIMPRWDDDSLADLWLRWGRVADADGVLDIYGMQALGIRSVLASGEVFIRRRPRKLSMGLPVPLQVQLIESEFCPVFDSDQWPGMPSGNTIRQGVELTNYGERVAYWMYKKHPGDGPSSPGQNDLIRIPARDIKHVYEVKRPGQLRGVSSLAPILVRLRATGDFEDAVLDRQKLANLFTMFITRQMPEDWDELDIDPETGLPKFYDKDGSPMASLEPGISQELKPGEDVKFANPPEAGTTFSDYLRTTMLGTASGQGLPYELFSGDIANVSDRTLRVIIQEFRRFAEQRQWHMVIPMMCQPIVEWFADAGALAGAIPMSKLAAAKSPEHAPHGWDYIHPVQDVEGKVLAIQNGLSSRTRAITGRGDAPKKIDQERADDQKREKALGIEVVPPPAKPGSPAPAKKEDEPPKPSNELLQIMSTVTQMMGAMQALVGHVTAMATQQPQAAAAPAQAPQFIMHNHLPAPNVTVEPSAVSINVEPAAVTIEPTVVNVAAPNVTVEPPAVNVAAPTVNVTNEVQPAEVSVNLPDRETKSTIKRNAAGDIVDVTQIERTLN